MKKIIYVFLALLTIGALIMTGCDNDSDGGGGGGNSGNSGGNGGGNGGGNTTGYTVRFTVGEGASAVEDAKVTSGGKVTKPADPTKQYYDFVGWYKEAALTNLWNFDTDTVTRNTILYAKWEPSSTGDPDPEDVARAEKVILANAWYVVYRIDLPAGKKWSDYKELTASYMLTQRTIDEGVGRGMRLMGPYRNTDFMLCMGAEGGLAPGKGVAVASYNREKNAPFILDNTYGSSPWGGSDIGSLQDCLNAAIGYTPDAEQWFTIKYVIDGSKKHTDYLAANLDNNATGPFYFGLGLPGQGPSDNQGANPNTSYMRDVTFVGYEDADTVVGKPVIFVYDNYEWPAYTGYNNTNGTAGHKEAERVIPESSGLEPIKVTVDWDITKE